MSVDSRMSIMMIYNDYLSVPAQGPGKNYRSTLRSNDSGSFGSRNINPFMLSSVSHSVKRGYSLRIYRPDKRIFFQRNGGSAISFHPQNFLCSRNKKTLPYSQFVRVGKTIRSHDCFHVYIISSGYPPEIFSSLHLMVNPGRMGYLYSPSIRIRRIMKAKRGEKPLNLTCLIFILRYPLCLYALFLRTRTP